MDGHDRPSAPRHIRSLSPDLAVRLGRTTQSHAVQSCVARLVDDGQMLQVEALAWLDLEFGRVERRANTRDADKVAESSQCAACAYLVGRGLSGHS